MNDRKIKVALIHNIVSPYRINLFERIGCASDLDFTVYYLSENYSERNWEINKNNNYKYKILQGICLEFGNVIIDIKPSIFLNIIKNDPDVVILGGINDPSMMLAYLASKLRRKKIIVWSEGTSSATSTIGKLLLPFTKIFIKNCDSVIVPGSVSKWYYSTLGARSVIIAPNAVNHEFFSRAKLKVLTRKNELKKELGLIRPRYLLYVGQIIPRKGINVLISSYVQLRREGFDIGLVIVGDGPLRQMLQEKCRKEKIPDVHFTGWISDDEKAIYYSVCDVFVLPTREDVWGLVINEAMSSSLPVITTQKAGAAPDMIINGKNGFIIDHPEEKALTDAIRTLIKMDDKTLATVGRASREIIEAGFTYDIMAFNFIYAIRSTIGGDR